MFQRLTIRADVTDIRAVLAEANPAASDLDAAAVARLADIRERIGTQMRAAAGTTPAGGRVGKSGPARGGGPHLPARGGRPHLAARGWRPHLPAHGHRRRVVITSVAIPVLLAASAAGWAVATAWPASQVTDGIGCYASPSLQANTTVVSATGSDPTQVCARYWLDGVISGKRSHHLPSLVACALPNGGAVAVFPDTTCAALGLQPLPAGYRQAARQFGALSASLTAWFHRSRCVHETVAVAYVRRALRQFGLSGWRVVGYKPTPGGINGPCATFSAASEKSTIYVDPASGQGVEAVTVPALNQPRSACTQGHAPETARTVIRELGAALRAAGYSQWTVVIANPTSRAQPCYSAGYDPARHQVTLSSYARF